MDDSLYNCNKSTIYVLNTNYNYGNLGVLSSDLSSMPYSSHQYADGAGNSNGTSTATHSSCSIAALANLFPCSNAFGHLQSDDQTTTVKPNKKSQHSTNTCVSSAPSSTQSKKLPAITPTIIAKKTNFWKFLEEEKYKSNAQDYSNSNCDRNSNDVSTVSKDSQLAKGHLNLHIRSESRIESDSESSVGSCSNKTDCNKNKNHNSKNGCCETTAPPLSRNNSMDLYREAVEFLGLSCTLCDDCRCLDCQSRYFECDDDFESDELLEDCIDTFGHFDGGSFHTETDQACDINNMFNAVQLNRSRHSSGSENPSKSNNSSNFDNSNNNSCGKCNNSG